MNPARSLLFVPGDRPDRFDKAVTSGADIVCLCLEDAVAPEHKAQARHAALDYLRRPRAGTQLALRLNSPRSATGVLDLAALIESGAAPDLVVLPKTQSAEEAALVAEALGGAVAICPMIETVQGLSAATRIAGVPSVQGLMLGAMDLAAQLGVEPLWEPLLYARSSLVAACAGAGLALLDSIDPKVSDLEDLARSTRQGRALGFTGRACIHPTQVGVIHAAFRPTAEERAWAARVVEAFDSAGGGVALLDGKLIELPIAANARRVLERGEAAVKV